MSLSERNHPEASFIQWLSSKIGKKIGEPIGAGSVGVIFDLGKLVMKVAPFPFHELNPILNKNIEGVAKTYSHGKINVPKQFIVKNEFNEDAVQLGEKTVQLYRSGDYALYYLLMEKLDTSYYDIQADVEMVRDSIERFVWSEVDRDNSDSGLRFLWYHCNDEEMLKRMFDYVSDDMGTTAEQVFSELVVIFRNVKKHYNWKDIHVRQFGRNSKGQLVAFDFDNPNAPVSNFTKHMVAEDQESIKDEKVGKEFWFEYHCFESPASCDAEIWYRSHQKVQVLGISEKGNGETPQERGEAGEPRVYKVRFKDGLEWDVFEDELMDSPEQFYRPDPPQRPQKPLNETVENTFIAYHGSPQKITQFSDEFVGGVDAADQEGAGIYFTTSPENAAAFGENIYKVRLSGRFLSRQHPKEDVDVEELVQLIKMQDGWEDDAQNWAEDPEAGAYEAAYSAKEYNDDEAEVFQQIEADFYRDTSVKYVRNMTKLGYDGIITTAPRDYVNHYHIIVFNPAAIEVLEQFDSSLLNENFQQQVKITDEMAEYARQFESDEALLRSGGFDIDMLDRAAHGFSESDMKFIDAKELGIRWKPDWEQVKLEIKESGLSPEEWAKTIDLSEPIDVRYMEEPDMGYKRGFYVWDGHHRTMAAKILGKTLPCKVEITVNPIGVLAPNMGYDEFVRYVWKQANQSALTESIRMRIKEVVVDKDGNLIGFQSDDEEFSDFLMQWSMWLEEQFGEEVDGFQLYDAHSTGGDWLRDEYEIAVDLYPENQEKITYTLFKFEEDGERRRLDSQTIKAPRDFVHGSSPDEPWEFVTSNLRKYIKYATDKGLFLGLFEASVNEGEVQVEFDANYFKERIPFLKSFELQYDPKSSPNSSAPEKVTFFKKKEIENVTVQGEQTITFPRAVVMLDFYYYPYTTNQWEHTFYHMGLKCKVLLEDSKEVSSLTNKVMQAAMRLQMEKLSTSHEILVDDGQEFPNNEWDDAINEVNGSLFRLEEYLENFGSGLGDLHEAYSDVGVEYVKDKMRKLSDYPSDLRRKDLGDFTLIFQPYKEEESYGLTGKITAFDNEDETEIGNASFMPVDDQVKGAIDVRPDWRRRKVGTEMYKFVEEIMGKKIAPDTPHSDLASKFWAQKDRPFGEAQVYPFEKRAGNATDRFTYRFDVDGLRYVVDIWHDPRTHKYGQFEVEFSFMGQNKFAGRSKKNLEHLNSVLLTVATIVEKAVQDHKIKYIKIDAALEGGEDGGFMGMEDNIRSKVYKRFLARRYPQGALEGIGRFILIDMSKVFPQVFEGQDASYVDRLWALLNNISDEDITAELERNTTSTDPKVAYINTDAVENDKGMIYMDITVDEYVEAFDIEYENYDTEEEGSESFQSFDQLLSFIQQKFG